MKPELIVMLTLNDRTVPEAKEIFKECAELPVKLWGFKDVGINLDEMKALAKAMKDEGKTVYIETLETEEEKCIQSAQIVIECGADIMSGGKYFSSVKELLHNNGIGYVPAIGKIVGRPGILIGTTEEMAKEALKLKEEGVDGIDLASYRYDGDSQLLNRAIVESGVPVCVAGSIDSYQRLQEISNCGVNSFTIGSAFFNNKFGKDFPEQILKVVEFLDKR